MSGKRRTNRITIRSRNLLLVQVLYKQISDVETIIKVHGDKAQYEESYQHLGLVRQDSGWVPHITDELELNRAIKHRLLKEVPNEEAIRLFMLLFSSPNDMPPRVSSIDNTEEMRAAWNWLKTRITKAIHVPKHKMMRVFRDGPTRNLMIRLLGGNIVDGFVLDLEDAKKLTKLDLNDPEVFERRYQDEIVPLGLELGFLRHPQRAVFLYPGKPVVELRVDSVYAWIEELQELPGIQELLEKLERMENQRMTLSD